MQSIRISEQQEMKLGVINFEPDEEVWSDFCGRLKAYFAFNDTPPEKYVPALISCLKPKSYSLLVNLCRPQDPAELTFDQLVEKFNDHYEPKPSVISERYKFHQCCQGPTESIAEFVAKLRRLSQYCNFSCDNCNRLNEALRDRFVLGLNSEGIRKRLLCEKEDLTLLKAVEIAQNIESAVKQNDAMSGMKTSSQPDVEINKMFNRKHCNICGKNNHTETNCYYKNNYCYICKKKGHVASVCRFKQRKNHSEREQASRPRTSSRKSYGTGSYAGDRNRKGRNVKFSNTRSNSSQSIDSVYNIEHEILQVGKQKNDEFVPKYKLPCLIGKKMINFELDTGSEVSIMPKAQLPNEILMQRSDRKLRSASGHPLKVAGEALVQVKCNGTVKKLKIYLIDGIAPSLFGRSWIKEFFGNNLLRTLLSGNANTNKISANEPDQIKKIVDQYRNSFFKNELGLLKNFKANLYLKPDAVPKYFKPRQVPITLEKKVNETIDEMVRQGQLAPVNYSEWGTPVVPVVKPDNTIRICGDYKVTLNPQLLVPKYPMPRIDTLMRKIRGIKYFAKLDLSAAYNQVELSQESSFLTTMSTTKGLFRWLRLPFGISSSPAIFQSIMDSLLNRFPFVVVYLDDILVLGATVSELADHLNVVLKELSKHGLRGRLDKCNFCSEQIEYLGYFVDGQGIKANKSKIDAILKMPAPTNIKQVESFCGLCNYYNKFIKNFSTIIAPLNQLKQKESHWQWEAEQQQAFENLKTALASTDLLVHFDPTVKLRLDTDASSVGIGAVLSHIYPDGQEKPISFASRTLTKAEQKWSQIDREACAIIYGVKKFYQYLYGNKFELITDHKPLTAIFHPNKQLPAFMSARLQRWAMFLMQFQYEIRYRNTSDHSNADGLSRLPISSNYDSCGIEEEVMYTSFCEIHELSEPLMDYKTVSEATENDKILSLVKYYIENEWPESVEEEISPYKSVSAKLKIHADCVLLDNRVVIPRILRHRVFNLLHSSHFGFRKMFNYAKNFVWWPTLAKDIQNNLNNCSSCKKFHNNPPKAKNMPLPLAIKPWERIHIDYAQWQGFNFLLIVDAYSKWVEIIRMMNTSSNSTIEALRDLFWRYGLPETLVSDNGPQFTSKVFYEFMHNNAINHIKTAPYMPKSNGQVERYVQTFKQSLMKQTANGADWRRAVQSFLFSYRNMNHSLTGKSPAELFLGRRLRSRLDLLRPKNRPIIKRNKNAESKRTRFLEVGDRCLAKAFRNNEWLEGNVIERRGKVLYRIKVGNIILTRHIDQLRVVQTRDTKQEERRPKKTEHIRPEESDDLYMHFAYSTVKDSDSDAREISQNALRGKSDAELSEISRSSRCAEADSGFSAQLQTPRRSARIQNKTSQKNRIKGSVTECQIGAKQINHSLEKLLEGEEC